MLQAQERDSHISQSHQQRLQELERSRQEEERKSRTEERATEIYQSMVVAASATKGKVSVADLSNYMIENGIRDAQAAATAIIRERRAAWEDEFRSPPAPRSLSGSLSSSPDDAPSEYGAEGIADYLRRQAAKRNGR
jgi:hypothetical protein